MSWFEIEFILLKHLQLQPNVLDDMPFYRAEYLMENFKRHNDSVKERERNENDNGQININSLMNQQKNMMNSMKKQNFSMPNMPKLK